MPLYVYACPSCGRVDDLHRSVAERDSAAPYCPAPLKKSKLGACGRMVRVPFPAPVAGIVVNPAVPRRRNT